MRTSSLSRERDSRGSPLDLALLRARDLHLALERQFSSMSAINDDLRTIEEDRQIFNVSSFFF